FFGFSLEVLEQARPAAVHVLAHLLAAFGTHHLELAVLELDTGGVRAVRNESDLDLGAHRGIGLPFAIDVPAHDETTRRLPHDDLAHVRPGAVLRDLVPMSAQTGFHDRCLSRRRADAVIEGPPTSQPGCEHFEGARLARLHAYALAHRRNFHRSHCHLCVPFCSLAPRSTSIWNAASASSQNWSI